MTEKRSEMSLSNYLFSKLKNLIETGQREGPAARTRDLS
jgi:hypothetical protein